VHFLSARSMLESDRCAFSHGPNHACNRNFHTMAHTPVTEDPPLKKALGSLYKCIQEQKLPQVNLSKAVEPPPVAKPMSKAKIAPTINNAGVLMNVTQRHG